MSMTEPSDNRARAGSRSLPTASADLLSGCGAAVRKTSQSITEATKARAPAADHAHARRGRFELASVTSRRLATRRCESSLQASGRKAPRARVTLLGRASVIAEFPLNAFLSRSNAAFGSGQRAADQLGNRLQWFLVHVAQGPGDAQLDGQLAQNQKQLA